MVHEIAAGRNPAKFGRGQGVGKAISEYCSTTKKSRGCTSDRSPTLKVVKKQNVDFFPHMTVATPLRSRWKRFSGREGGGWGKEVREDASQIQAIEQMPTRS